MYTLGVSESPQIQKGKSNTGSKLDVPNWNTTPHKGMERPSDTEFDSIIDNLAKLLAEAHYQQDDSKYNRLWSVAENARAQYISAVSPDRAALANEAQQYFNKSSNEPNKNVNGPKNIIDYLNQKDRMEKPTKDGRYNISLNSGTMVVTGSDLEPNTFDLKCSPLGQTVMSHNPYGWTWTATPQEQMMSSSFLNRLNSAEDKYYREISGIRFSPSLPTGIESTGSRLDTRA
ncbi:hypothetical protein [Clostridium merdae]|uniref:hypothetical protein n=1 Tax=Clostridium merdae TaxID=1958780 RepID=UPI000A26DE7E|nr:hypothetical protein [Clostridium merdae]